MHTRTELNDRGDMRVVVGNAKGEYADYHDIATLVLEVNGKLETYIAITEYGLSNGVLKPETVYKATEA